VPPQPRVDDPALRVTLWNRVFPNPLGLAAGFDKNAAVTGPLLRLGFGFVEAGTVTPKPQHGNPTPRIFRDPINRAVINRMGFPNDGMNVFQANLTNFLGRKPRPAGMIGVNIGMNKSSLESGEDISRDYCLLVRQLGPLADYLTVNISSPNTPGLRDLQSRDAFLELTGKILEERARACGTENPPPLLVKLAPDLTAEKRAELAAAALQSGIDGLILTNTTLDRPESLPAAFRAEKGGLSGEPLRDKSTAVIADFYRLTGGKLPLIGAGGVSDGDDAYEKIRAGATLVQLYTALVFHGPAVIHKINTQILKRLRADGFTNVAAAVGTGADTGMAGKTRGS
jgi:dihydroorotate dehydrogenase